MASIIQGFAIQFLYIITLLGFGLTLTFYYIDISKAHVILHKQDMD